MKLSVYLHFGAIVCIRAVCLSGSMTTKCERPSILSHPNDFDRSTLYEMDAVNYHRNNIEVLVSASHIGDKLTLVHENEANFVKPDSKMVGVILGKDDRLCTWYLMMKSRVPDHSCDEDIYCMQTVHTHGGVGEFMRANFVHNTKYYICAHSNATVSKEGNTTEVFDEISTCGNGFVVDNAPPLPGNVVIIADIDGFLTSSHNVRIVWDDFKDVEEDMTELKTGIAKYMVSVGEFCFSILHLV